MTLDWRALADMPERQLLNHLIEQQEQITMKADDIKADLTEALNNEQQAQADLTAIKGAVLASIPVLQAKVIADEAHIADLDAQIATLQAAGALSDQQFTDLQALSASMKTSAATTKATADDVLASVQPVVPPVEPPA